jgi:hypothetical protein
VRKLREIAVNRFQLICFVGSLGLDMIEAGGTFGPDGSYGAALIKTGENFESLSSNFVCNCCLFSPRKQVKQNKNSVKLNAISSPTPGWVSSSRCASKFTLDPSLSSLTHSNPLQIPRQ